ncbi:uncharacterized protein LOC141619085 [Silene latifolia]|uniref:uncharacterized protein LOC141619085 n=1 Tax=Silene latifolia TaxID=37657 RepID=UPI003D789BB0
MRNGFLIQKAKAKWLEQGDNNTAYFHGVIKQRCNQNKVIQIDDQYGHTCNDSEGIQNAFLDYYQVLLGSSTPTERVRDQVINTGKCCTLAHIDILNAPVTNQEIKQTFFAIPIDKSLGPDGFTSGFFKDSWQAPSPRCLFKIDLQKAYDTVEWGFVAQLFQKMGFPETFTQRVMTYVQTTSFSLGLIGSSFGYFRGKHGLRQGDPISPLIFTGNAQSIMLLIKAFSSFSKASGLKMNNTKSKVYFNGVAQELKTDIQQVTCFIEGSMPFRYRGVPIQAGKLTKTDCNILTEKMVNRITSLGAKKLSYAGRIVLINSVLNTLYSYWAGIFLIPKAVIKRIEAICRNFLWDRSSNYHRVPLNAWHKVTLPKEEGDWIYGKANRLWVRWINHIYLKNGSWHDYSPPADAAWAWKSICKVKEKMKLAYVHDQWSPDSDGYSVKQGYDWLRHRQNKQDWYTVVWNKSNVAKHVVITWLAINNGLNVREKLFRISYTQESNCCNCECAAETTEHLFFKCDYSKKLGVMLPELVFVSMGVVQGKTSDVLVAMDKKLEEFMVAINAKMEAQTQMLMDVVSRFGMAK